MRNNGKVSAGDAINSLSELVKNTGARIILTSRTTFWESEFPEDRVLVPIYNIIPFDVNQARNYFTKRFSTAERGPEKVNNSVNLFTQLRQSTPDLAGRGFVLRLIADLFNGDEPVADHPAGRNTALWLFKALCTRDQARHDLPLDATEQIEAIQEFILASLSGADPDSELLDLAISQVAPRLDDSARHAAIKKMTSHPLIFRVSGDGDEWRVSQEQVCVILVARFISNCASSGNAEQLGQLTRDMQVKHGFLRDLGNALIDLDFEAAIEADSERVERARSIVQTILKAADHDHPTSKTILSRLAGIMLLRLVDSFAGKQHIDRSAMLFDAADRNSVRNVTFSGTIASLNLSGRVFESCRFEHVRWHNCEFDENTRFEKCHFDGIELNKSDSIIEADFDDSTYDEVARDYLKRIEIARGKRNYGPDDLEGDIRCVLQKFAPRGGLVPRTQKENYLASGTIRVSPYKDDVINAIKRDILDEHHISGTSEIGFHVRDDVREEFQFFVVNNVFTGRLKEVFEALRKKLKVG